MFRRIRNSLVGSLIILLMCFSATGSQAVENQASSARMARINFVNEFIREVEVMYRLQETAKKEFAEDGSTGGKLSTAIRMGTRTIMEMNTSIRMLEGITGLDEQWNKFRSILEQNHAQRISESQEIVEMTKKILRGPEPGVNYGDFSGRAPELTAQVEQLDKNIFDMSKALFFCLIDEKKVDKDGNNCIAERA
jgi:hypothetical protein